VHYLDAAGEVLDDFPTSHHGEAVPAHGEFETDLSTFFMPEETKSIRVELDSVAFVDLTQWRRSGRD
jgi:hypothetical protein